MSYNSITDIPLYDTAEFLDSPESVVAYIEAVMEVNDPALLADALGIVARAKGMAGIAAHTGLSRETLYRTLSPKGNPQLTTLLTVLPALGLQLSVRPLAAADPA